MDIANLIKTNITHSLSLADKRIINIISTRKPQKDIQSSLNFFSNKIEKLRIKNTKFFKELLDLNKMFTASNKGSILSKIENQINIVKEAHADWIEAKSIQIQIQERFAKNKAAAKLRKEAEDLVVQTEAVKAKAMQTLNRIAKEQRPVQLTSKDDFTNSLVRYIISTLKETEWKKKPVLIPTSSIYLVDVSSKGEIKFARYMPIQNLPTLQGTYKNLYLVLVVALLVHKQQNGKIIPLSPQSVSPLSITLAANIVDPLQLQDTYQVKSIREAKEVLSFLSQRQGLTVFLGEPVNKSLDQRRIELKEKLKILKDPSIKVTQDKAFIHIKIPADKVPPFKEGDVTPWEVNLFLDVQRIAGLPDSSRYTAGRLKLEKKEKKGNYWEFIFRVLPMNPAQKLIKDQSVSNNNILSQESKDWLRTFRDEAQKWM